MSVGIIFAISAAVVFGLWTVFHNQAANYISPVLGAVLVSLTAVIIGLPFLLKEWGRGIQVDSRGMTFVVLAGVMAFSIDYLVLRTYSSGVPISIGGPIVIGGSIAVAVAIGFLLGEQITVMKVFGIALVLCGAAVLSAITQ